MNKEISDTIRRVRKALGLKQREFADLFNTTEPLDIQTHARDISKYECGTNNCPVDKYLKFLSLL